MNRKIKFRGKRQGDGAWIYGENIHAFILDENGEKIWTIHPSGEPATHEGDGYIKFKPYIVDPDTVGQYTGFHDKNGKEIYDGDILRMEWDNDVVSLGRVGWEGIGFTLYTDDIPMLDRFLYDDAEGLEIIGNIHDNPELLEKKG